MKIYIKKIKDFVKKSDASIAVMAAIIVPFGLTVIAASTNISYLQNVKKKTADSLNVVCTNLNAYITDSLIGWRQEGADRAFGNVLDLYKLQNYLEGGFDGQQGNSIRHVAKAGKHIFDAVKVANGLGANAQFRYRAGTGAEIDSTKNFFQDYSHGRGEQNNGYGSEALLEATIQAEYPFDFGLLNKNIQVSVNCNFFSIDKKVVFEDNFDYFASYLGHPSEYLTFSQMISEYVAFSSMLQSDVTRGITRSKYEWTGINVKITMQPTISYSGTGASIELDSTSTGESESYYRTSRGFVFVGRDEARIFRTLHLEIGNYELRFKKYSTNTDLTQSAIGVYFDEVPASTIFATKVMDAANSVHGTWLDFSINLTVSRKGYHVLGFRSNNGAGGYLDEIKLCNTSC